MEEPEKEAYVGNIWGWRFSLFGLILIGSLTGLLVYRHYTMGVPPGFEEPPMGISIDSTQVED